MTTLQATEAQNTEGFWNFGDYQHKDDETFLQDAARVADLAKYTVVARQQSDLKLIPLTDLSPALVPGNMVCGAIGGTAADFAVLTDAELSIDINGETIELADMDMSGLDSVLDTPGYMTCGAIGSTLPEFAAVADGQFGIAFDGEAAIQVGGMDFSGIDSIEDTPGYWLCGANGDVIGNWDALTDAAFSYVVDGVAYDTGVMNLTLSVDFGGLIDIINFHLNGHATMEYAFTVDKFQLVSNRTGETSSVTIGAPAAGTDISAAGYLNAAAGAATAGTGGENLGETMTSIINAALLGRGFCYMNGDAFVFVSRTAGEVSAVSALTVGTAGTDISGTGGGIFLNGLAGTTTDGTGGEGLYESIAEIINAHAAGRFTCEFDGDAFVFISPTSGVLSTVSVLSDPAAGGTDITGAAFLNGLTGTGTPTVGTGEVSNSIPIGIFIGGDILTADLVAGDVTDQYVAIYGDPAGFDVDKLVLENSLDIDDIVVGTGQSIRQHLTNIGLIASATKEIHQTDPLT